MSIRSGHRRPQDERGAAAIIMALTITLILVAAGLVLDFGIIRLDRQANKLVADDAVMAGLRAADGGSADMFTQRGVCAALAFLKANKPELSALPDTSCNGNWAASQRICDQANPNGANSATNYLQSTTANGVSYTVQIKAPYQVSEGNFPEESLATLANDPSQMNGCDQLAVIITETRTPGLGRIITDHISTRTRSVGRVSVGPGHRPPALLLLERTHCSVLVVGAAGSGTASSIRVNASGDTPGTIHSDSAATESDCGSGSNQQVFQGKQANGIVAGASSVASGWITSVAAFNHKDDATPFDPIAYDSLQNVHALSPTGALLPPDGMPMVTRGPVDDRYADGVRTALKNAKDYIWGLNPNNPGSPWTRVTCNPGLASLAALTASDSLYVDCPGNSGIVLGSGTTPAVIGAGRIVFNGFIKGGAISMPNATSVYITNTASNGSQVNADGVALSGSDAFCMQAVSCDAATASSYMCPLSASVGSAKLYILKGSFKQTGGLLRLCHTTILLLGGQDDGCVPSTNGTAPTLTPCNGAAGSGQLLVNGGIQDWTSPNAFAASIPDADQASAWGNGEDLALWAESAATTSDKYSMGGGGFMNVVGIFMTPNAVPFQLNGGSSQGLINAQFIASTFAIGGNSNLTMTVDPDNTVTIPALDKFVLVR